MIEVVGPTVWHHVGVPCARDGRAVKLGRSSAHNHVGDAVTVQAFSHCCDLLIAHRHRGAGFVAEPPLRSALPLFGRAPRAEGIRNVSSCSGSVQALMLATASARIMRYALAWPADCRKATCRSAQRREAAAAVCSRFQRFRSARGLLLPHSSAADACTSGGAKRIRRSKPDASSRRISVGIVGWRRPFS